MDVFRFLRALQARGIERIEQTRSEFKKGKLKAENITADEWDRIKEHDEIIAAFE
jgi:hypothetical protein